MPDLSPSPYNITVGSSPLLVSIPHTGVAVPDSIRSQWTPGAVRLPDTDWFLDRLYDWLPEFDATVITANYSRYVVDLNRPPDDQRLYDTTTTGLFPTEQFDGSPIYRDHCLPTDEDRQQRLDTFYGPYHRRIVAERDRLRALHGYAIVFDAHSIRSQVPRLFPGVLPDLNLGTNRSASCSSKMESAAIHALRQSHDYSLVVNGRFQGGYITRHYGQPSENMHAVQLELSQRTYMDDSETEYAETRAARLQTVLRRLLSALLSSRPTISPNDQ